MFTLCSHVHAESHPPFGARLRRSLLAGFLATFFVASGVMPATAAPAQVPPLVEPAGAEHHVGKVVFEELVTPDLAAAKQFYQGLFGWSFRDVQEHGVNYVQAYLDGRVVAGLVHKPMPAGEQKQSAWLSFIAVRDVDAAKKTATEHGAKVLREPHDLPNRGREAVFADPQGAVFAVLASSSGDPADLLAEPGEWIWSSLHTTDPDTDAAFYQAVFDYEVFEQPSSPGAQHLTFATDNYARASANSLPADAAKALPRWISYIRVDDAVKMAAKVTQLGGRVLVEPREDRHGGKIAIVSDPGGARFGLMEWSDSENKESGK